MLRKIVHGDRRDGADDRLGAGPAGGKNLLPRTPLLCMLVKRMFCMTIVKREIYFYI